MSNLLNPYRFSGAAVPTFTSTWETTNTSTGSSNSDQIALPLVSGGTYNFEVDWGDGNSDTITAFDQAEVTHTYAVAGEYELKVTGTIEGFAFESGKDRLKVLTIDGGGVLNIGNVTPHFKDCANLTSLKGLDATGVTSLLRFVETCSSLSALDFTDMDTSAVTDCDIMCADCVSLTSIDLSPLDMSSANTMVSMLDGCSGLTAIDLSVLDTSNVTNMQRLLRNCTSITSVNTTGLDTSSVTNMLAMFNSVPADEFGAQDFDVGALTEAGNMFAGTDMLTSEYDALLVNWEAQAVNDSVSFHAGTSTYTGGSAAATARQALIDDHSWTITDGGTA